MPSACLRFLLRRLLLRRRRHLRRKHVVMVISLRDRAVMHALRHALKVRGVGLRRRRVEMGRHVDHGLRRSVMVTSRGHALRRAVQMVSMREVAMMRCADAVTMRGVAMQVAVTDVSMRR